MNAFERWRMGFACLMLTFAKPAWSQPAPAEKGAVTASGKVTSVTLFRDSALVTRTIPLTAAMKLTPGAHEVLITGLPERIVSSTVFAEGSDLVAIRAVRVTEEPVIESTREEVQKLDEQLKQLAQDIERINVQQTVIKENLTALAQMISFSQNATRTDLANGVLDAESVTQLLELSMNQRGQLYKEQLELKQKSEEIEAHSSQLTRQRAQLTNVDSRSRYLARVFIDVGGEADAELPPLRLVYSVTGCNWSPQYTVSGNVESDQFQLRYGAIIGQLSGENWQGVALTLSTASPSVNAAGPMLLPLRVTAITPSDGRTQSAGQPSAKQMDDLFGGDDPFGDSSMSDMDMGMSSNVMPSQMAQANSPYKAKMKSLRSLQRKVENQSNRAAQNDRNTNMQRDQQLNRLAGQMQEIEFMAAARQAGGLASDAEDEVASQTYVLEGPVSLQSKREQQLVEIVDKSLNGKLYHVATPLLSSFAYREAELINELPYGLLSGPASVYLDDRFVGTMAVPTTASGQLLRLGFGADGQVRTRRELVNKAETVQGGNRRLNFKYKLVVNNFKDQPIQVRLLDRIPKSNQTQQTQVSLGEVSEDLSEDKLYNRVSRPAGILRWDLNLLASTHGADATDVVYDFTIEFDRNRLLSVPVDKLSNWPMIQGGMGGGMGGGGR